ncbi:MAG: hypothetical protein ACJAR1_001333 [Rubritalea sp.]|jgi:hypothetical protein
MSCASVTFALSISTFAEVLVTVAFDTPSNFKSADCTFGGHPTAHLRPVRTRETVSALTAGSVTASDETTTVFAADTIPSMEQDVMPASRISLFVLFMVIDESSQVSHLFQKNKMISHSHFLIHFLI